ncbi:hypothetical protein H4R33_001372 [Dimargaris cristalligena]|nr:hypothetical protein H4R33_001372 [Dimargaris cristalligena]
MAFRGPTVALWCVLWFSLLCPWFVQGRLELVALHDSRPTIPLVQFGVKPGGQLRLFLQDFQITGPALASPEAVSILMHHDSTPARAKLYLTGSKKDDDCPLNDPALAKLDGSGRLLRFPLGALDLAGEWRYEHNVTAADHGTWIAALVNCNHAQTALSFKFHTENRNPGNNHLSAGDIPLPRLYLGVAIAYLALVALWVRTWYSGNPKRSPVQWHHKLILVYLILVAVDKFLQSYRYAHLAEGRETDVWIVGFYVFAFLKGILGIIIITMISSGWLFIRPFLTSRDKQVISCVVPLQILANIAHIVQSETPLGSMERSTWTRIIPFVDFGAFLVILWTIIQTRKHLYRASQIDGKAAENLRKYKIWGTFYVLTLVYLYGTRIIAQLLNVSLPYQCVRWVSELIVEVTSILFYIAIGMKIRPSSAADYGLLDDGTTEDNGQATSRRRARESDEFALDDPWQDHSDNLYIPLQVSGDASSSRRPIR